MSNGLGRARVEAELADFSPSAVTVRVVQAALGSIPQCPPLSWYSTLTQAADVLGHGAQPTVLAQAEGWLDLPGVEEALAAARSIDETDRGSSVLSTVRSAFSMFLGGEQDDGQRADAAVKAHVLAYVVDRLLPDAESRNHVLEHCAAARQVLQYFAAVDIALPFQEAAQAAGGTFVAQLVLEQGPRVANKLLGMIGRAGLERAQAVLPQLVATLDAEVVAVLPHASGLSDQLQDAIPGDFVGGHAATSLAAAGADRLPAYRWLVARLCVETSLSLSHRRAAPAARSASETPNPFANTAINGVAAAPASVPQAGAEPTPEPANPFVSPAQVDATSTPYSAPEVTPPAPINGVEDPTDADANGASSPLGAIEDPADADASVPAEAWASAPTNGAPNPFAAPPFPPPAAGPAVQHGVHGVVSAPATEVHVSPPEVEPESAVSVTPAADSHGTNPFAPTEPANPFAAAGSAPEATAPVVEAATPPSPSDDFPFMRPSAPPPVPVDRLPPPAPNVNPEPPAAPATPEPAPIVAAPAPPIPVPALPATPPNPFEVGSASEGPPSAGLPDPFAEVGADAPLPVAANPFATPQPAPSAPPPVLEADLTSPDAALVSHEQTAPAEEVLTQPSPMPEVADVMLAPDPPAATPVTEAPTPWEPLPENPFAISSEAPAAESAAPENPFTTPAPAPENPFAAQGEPGALDDPFARPAPAAPENPFATPEPAPTAVAPLGLAAAAAAAAAVGAPSGNEVPASAAVAPSASGSEADVPEHFNPVDAFRIRPDELMGNAAPTEPVPQVAQATAGVVPEPAPPSTEPAVVAPEVAAPVSFPPVDTQVVTAQFDEIAPVLAPADDELREDTEPTEEMANPGVPVADEPSRPYIPLPSGAARREVEAASADAPPAPPPTVIPTWPTDELPEDERLRGAYLSTDGRWRIFSKEGIFTDFPPSMAPADWDAHWTAGYTVALYKRRDNHATIEYFDAVPESFTVERETYSLKINGETWRRTDYDLSERTMQGRWTNDDGSSLELDHDGNATLDGKVGQYRLGAGRIHFAWPQGQSETRSFLSTLTPSSRHPNHLWLGGVAYAIAT